MPSFRQVLEGIADVWATRRADAETQGAQIARGIARATAPPAMDADDAGLADQVFSTLARAADRTWGRVRIRSEVPATDGRSPGCCDSRCEAATEPSSSRRPRSTGWPLEGSTIRSAVASPVTARTRSGTSRISRRCCPTTRSFLQLYTHAWLATGTDRYRRVAISTADYLIGELRRPEGGFASSQDADTDGIEGATYVWPWGELVDIVGEAVADAFGARPEGNWEGTNILWLPEDLETVASRHRLDAASLETAVDDGRQALLARRRRRAQPLLDDKVVAGGTASRSRHW